MYTLDDPMAVPPPGGGSFSGAAALLRTRAIQCVFSNYPLIVFGFMFNPVRWLSASFLQPADNSEKVSAIQDDLSDLKPVRGGHVTWRNLPRRRALREEAALREDAYCGAARDPAWAIGLCLRSGNARR
jgi:hypothetical protein